MVNFATMPLCGAGKAVTPLQNYAESLLEQNDVPGSKIPTPFFPMYTLPLPTLLDMGEIEPHEALMAKGALVEFEQKLGKAAFVSHQWVGLNHPDPEP